MKIVFIHGAGASSKSFNYLRTQLGLLNNSQCVLVEYDCKNRFYSNLEHMVLQLQKLELVKEDLFFVGHSLGGVFAMHLSKKFKNRTLGGFTMSTPYKGSKAADILTCVYPTVQLYKDISPYSRPILESLGVNPMQQGYSWTALVTTGSRSSIMNEPNDGVVTLASQTAQKGISYEHNSSGHYEVLQDSDVVYCLQKLLFSRSTVSV